MVRPGGDTLRRCDVSCSCADDFAAGSVNDKSRPEISQQILNIMQ